MFFWHIMDKEVNFTAHCVDTAALHQMKRNVEAKSGHKRISIRFMFSLCCIFVQM